MVCLLTCAQMGVWADKIPVAELKTNGGGNKTLTFTMVDESTTVSSANGVYALNTGTRSPGWYGSNTSIDSVVFESSFADARPTSLYYWFYGARKLVSIEGIQYLNTSEVTTSTRMFYNSTSLTSFDMSHFNLAKNKDMSYMFYGCSALTGIKLGDNLNTDSVADMQRLCYGCTKLANFDFSKLHTQSVTNFQYMFYMCRSLTSADISTFDFTSVDTVMSRTGYCYLFAMCSGLTSVNVGNNMFPGATSNARPFYGVGSSSKPVELKIGSKFDKSVLGTISNGSYSWLGGHFSEPTVVEDPVVYPKPTTPQYVDLGLSVKWATFNLGATAPEEGGYYYSWGETEPKASYSWDTYKFGPDSLMTKYNKTDSLLTLAADDDAAAVALGGNWRMPTADEFDELHDNCTWTSTTQNGVKGILVTASNGNSIFLPAAGAKGYNVNYPDSVIARTSTNFYWTSSKYISEDNKARAKYYWSSNFFDMSYNRSFGLSVRPVYDDGTTPQPSANKKPMAILAANGGGNKTMTFTMVDDTTKAVSSGDGAYSLNTGTTSPKWSASSVDTVVFDKSFAEARPTTMYRWFYSASKLKTIIGIENLNTSEVTSTQYAFNGCSSLDSLDMSHFNLAKATSMSYMFYGCSKLKSVKFGDLHTDSVKDMQRLFYGCQNLASVDFSKLNTTSLTNVQYMFYNCSSLQTIDISSIDLAKVDTTDQSWRTGYAYMFANCTGVTSVNVGNNMFKGTTKNDRPFYRVGTADSPVELKIGSKFDKTVLGSNANGYYNWQGGYFAEPSVVSTAKYVDLGLSVKWGEANLGAEAPEEKGNYYAWGETAPKESYSWDTYKFGATDSTITKYNKVDSLLTLQPEDDAASVALGGKWRMPTASEFEELKENCTWTQTTQNGVEGVKITAANGNSIFLPFTGHYQTNNPTTLVGTSSADYWTSSKYIFSNVNAVAKERMRGNDRLWNFSWGRAYGLAVRPVYDESSSVVPDTTETKKDSVYVAILGTKADGKTRTLRFTRVAEITEKGSSGKDGMYTLPTGTGNPGWYSAAYNVDTVTIDSSFAGARPITTRRWFYGMMNLQKIVGIENLNTSESTDMYYMFYNCNKLDSLDLSHFNTAKVTSMTDMFYNCSSLTYLDVSNFNTENVTDMTYMFYNCGKLNAINVKNFNTAKVTGMRSMFYNCSSISSLDLSSFNVENVTNMSQMFYNCSGLKSLDISSFKPVNATNIRGMFSGLVNVETLKLGEFSTPKVTDMGQLFYRCEKVKELNVSKFNTENVTSMRMMFDQCMALTSLDLSNFNTAKVTEFDLMFYHCDKLQSLNLKSFDTSNATSIRLMFSNCTSLKELDLSNFNTSKVTSMDQMFYNCSNLTKLEVGNFDTHLATSFFQLFGNCSSLKTVDVSKWNTENVTGFTHMFVGCTSLQKVDVSKFNTAKSTSFRFMFSNCGNLEELDVDSFDTGNATNFFGMFNGCTKLTKIDVSHFNTEKATTMYGMFYGCANVEELDLSSFRTPYLQDMGIMFTGCSKLTKLDISTFTTDSIIVDTEGDRPTGYYGTFNNCTGLKELNVGNNSFKGAKSTDVVMYGVGTQKAPCLLIVGDQFDTTVLGRRLLGVYSWLSGYFNLAYATGIKSVAEDGQGTGYDPDAPAYDLTGRRVNASYRGVVIQNGKKYVRK